MSKIIKKVVMGTDGMHFACGPCGGQDLIEMIIDHAGKEMFVSAASIGEDVLYYVSDHSIYSLMEDMDENINDEVIEWYECGSINDYENEDEVAQSEYYDCFKYLTMILNDAFHAGSEYTENYGDDIESMSDLISFSEYDFCPDEDFCFDDDSDCTSDGNVISREDPFQQKLFLEANIKNKTVYDTVDSSIKQAMEKELAELNEFIEDFQYEPWKERFLEAEYEKVKNKNWLTIDYLFAGIGNFSVSIPEEKLPEFECWIRSMGSAFMSEPKAAEKEDILHAIALNLFE